MPYRVASLIPQTHTHTHIWALTESYESNRSRPQKNLGRDLYLRVVAGSYGWLRINANVRCVTLNLHDADRYQ